MSDSYWLIVVMQEFLLADCRYSKHDARTRGPRVGRKYCRRGQEMRFFMITRHHTGDGKYFEPIVNIMTEGVLRLALINIGTIQPGPLAACVGRCWVMSNEKLPRRNVMPRYSEQ